MKYLIIDGNSIINRAFYGIKLLNAKDGHYTNAIYGFFNILLNLKESYSPDSVIVAFDVHHPTFRHEIYSEYKAGRKGAPPELLEQFEPLKELLKAYGCKIVECPGFEADDILGTISNSISNDDHCYIATGDRDSLQLIKNNVTVLLTTTRSGKTQTVEYNIERLYEEYGVSPAGMIEIKALQGDNSDNIPGVAGIGPKTATELIRRYGNIDYIYDNIDDIEVTSSVRQKLISGKDSAFFSKKLGTISLNADICTDMKTYLDDTLDREALLKELAKHEMFKIISRLKLNSERNNVISKNEIIGDTAASELKFFDENFDFNGLNSDTKIYITCEFNGNVLVLVGIKFRDQLYILESSNLFFVNFLKSILESDSIKYVDDYKMLYSFCLKNKISPKNISFDIRLAAYLLDVNTSDYSIESLALSYNVSALKLKYDDAYSGFMADNNEFCNRASVAAVLSERLMSIIQERNQTDLLRNIEIPLAEVLVSMESHGIKIDVDGIKYFSEKLDNKISDTEKQIFNLAGESFNINSPKQLGSILFEKLGLPAKKKTKTGYSTSADVLDELASEYSIVSLILDFRAYSKLKSTYCDGLLRAVDSDGRVRSTFNQTETRTGRLSSTEPNLQNIPVRTELGREMRKFFISEKDYCIIDADYSQIELRVLAALSGDKNMIKAFNSDCDIHTLTAAKVFDIKEEEVTSELRGKAKAVNFGIIYGIGAFSLSKDIKTTRAEADSFIKSYLALYSSVDDYMKKCISDAKEMGYSITHFNRRRYLPELSSSNGMLRAFGERVARNMPIQGTAADIIKIAMIRVHNRLKAEFPDSRLIMQVHDELMAEVPKKDARAVAELIKTEMENAVSLSVKLIADTAIGNSWYEAKN